MLANDADDNLAMSRPLRIEFPDAIYHVTARGDRREPIFVDDQDRAALLAVVAHAMGRFDARMLAFCLMSNHYHFVLQTRQANLSRLMRYVNGTYTQRFNRRHDEVGHLFQGRFHAILVDRDSYLLSVCRYVELNPVRAGLMLDPAAWPWSSYLAHVGRIDGPAWLDTPGLHDLVLPRTALKSYDRTQAAARYAELVAEGLGKPLWSDGLAQQIYLGDQTFVDRMQTLASKSRVRAEEVPKAQRRRVRSLGEWLSDSPSREDGLRRAYCEGNLTMTAMAKALGLSVSQISRLISKAETKRPY